VAASYDVHDHGRALIGLFSGWLYHLSRSRRRKIFRIHRLDRRRLLPNTGFARSACLCDVASGDFDPGSGFSSPMGSSQADRALDDPNLAIRFRHGRVCVFNALQMVSSGNVMQAILPAKDHLRRQDCLRHVQSLAHGNDLMFDQPMRAAAHARNVYGNYCDVQ
jgi:hypothetical protein